MVCCGSCAACAATNFLTCCARCCRVPIGTVDAVLSYCHNNLADNTLTGILPYLQEKKVAVISASFSSMGLLTQKVR